MQILYYIYIYIYIYMCVCVCVCVCVCTCMCTAWALAYPTTSVPREMCRINQVLVTPARLHCTQLIDGDLQQTAAYK